MNTIFPSTLFNYNCDIVIFNFKNIDSRNVNLSVIPKYSLSVSDVINPDKIQTP